VLYGPGLLERDRESGQRLMRAYLRGARDYEDAFGKGNSRDEIVGLLSGRLNTPRRSSMPCKSAAAWPTSTPRARSPSTRCAP
jgi:hypothetical protein